MEGESVSDTFIVLLRGKEICTVLLGVYSSTDQHVLSSVVPQQTKSARPVLP